MSINEFLTASVNGLPLTVVVLGLVTWLGKLGVTGKGKLVAAMLVGLLLGIAYQVASNGQPASFSDWFLFVIYGLSLGLFASGIYDTGKNLVGGETLISVAQLDRDWLEASGDSNDVQ